jgi:hypothetical protein
MVYKYVLPHREYRTWYSESNPAQDTFSKTQIPNSKNQEPKRQIPINTNTKHQEPRTKTPNSNKYEYKAPKIKNQDPKKHQSKYKAPNKYQYKAPKCIFFGSCDLFFVIYSLVLAICLF